jgi:inward rectifier potassium channel
LLLQYGEGDLETLTKREGIMAEEIAEVLTRPPSDMGFGAVVSNRRGYRLLNKDGSFNVRILGESWWKTLFSYHTLLTTSWPKFSLLLALGYGLLNGVFAVGYLACGPGALNGDSVLSPPARAFFFSVHTFATIGYGNLTPHTYAANVMVTIESFFGLFTLAVATGLVFARFSRPTAHVRFSNRAVVAPYGGMTALEFRVVNTRRNQLTNLVAVVMLSRFEGEGARRARRYYWLALERDLISFFPLNWTIVHPIDASSPLSGWTQPMMVESETQINVLLSGVDEAFAQTVHARSSYTGEEIDFGRKFDMMYSEVGDKYLLDISSIDSTHPTN